MARDTEFEKLLDLLRQVCLCQSLSNDCHKLFEWFNSIDDPWSELIENWDIQRLWIFASCIEHVCDALIKQYAQGRVCPHSVELHNAIFRSQDKLAVFLLKLANYYPDRFPGFVLSRPLLSFFRFMDVYINQSCIDQLIENIEECADPYKMSFSIGIFTRIMEWKDIELEDADTESEDSSYMLPRCQNMRSVKPKLFRCSDVKCIYIRALGRKWPNITSKFEELIRNDSSRYQVDIILQFLNLWKVVVSMKTCIPVYETYILYANLNNYVELLTDSTPAIIWNHILDLLNEVLCYGNAFALQEDLDNEPCELSHKILRNVKHRRLLNMVPYGESNNDYGGGLNTNNSDEGGNLDETALFEKIILLILKAVAITVKETHNDSSSDSDTGSGVEALEGDMAIIELSIRDVIKKLDIFIKGRFNYHPEIRLAQWIVHVFIGRDDILVEGMICCLDLALGLCYRENAHRDLQRDLNPSVTFLQFLQTLNFDPDMLYDLLISNDTNFLLYFHRVLKYLSRNMQEMLHMCSEHQLRRIDVLWKALRMRLKRAVADKSFPYNVSPILTLLKQCGKLFMTSAI